jgi:hypothetical protein
MGFARRLTRSRTEEFHPGLALMLSLVRYPGLPRLGRERVLSSNASVVARAVLNNSNV